MAQAIQLSKMSLWEIKADDETEYERMVSALQSAFKIICTDKENLVLLLVADGLVSISTALGKANPPIGLGQKVIYKKRPDLI